MKREESTGGIIAACLAVSAIITAQAVARLNLPLSWFGVLVILAVFALSALAVYVVGGLAIAIYQTLVEDASAGPGGKLLFWCVYTATLLIITLVLISIL